MPCVASCYCLEQGVLLDRKRVLSPGGGGGTPVYKPYRYMPPHRVGFLSCFGLKTGIHFLGTGFQGNYESV